MTSANPKLQREAPEIVQRLRDTDVTLTALMSAYSCGYEAIVRAILTQITKEDFRTLMKQRLGRGGIKCRFRPGHKTWNEGMKGFCPEGSKATQFKPGCLRGQSARKYRLVGSIIIHRGRRLSTQERARRRQSSRWIKVKDDGRFQDRYIPYARYVWEEEHDCPVPKGCFVGHKDNDLMNDSLENLVLLDHRTHCLRLYERPDVIAKCRERASVTAKRRHAQNREAKRWAKAQRVQTRTIWECSECSAEVKPGTEQCPKCDSWSIVRRKIEPMPESVMTEAVEREQETVKDCA